MKDTGDHESAEEASTERGEPPTTGALRSDWPSIQGTIREIHKCFEQHHTAERDMWIAQLSTAKRLNWITAIGAAVGVAGLIGIAFSVLIAKQASVDGHDALVAANRAWLGVGRIQFYREPVYNQPIQVGFEFNNYGHEPAVNVVIGYEFEKIPRPPGDDMSLLPRVPDDICRTNVLVKDYFGVVDPGTNSAAEIIRTDKWGIVWDDSLRTGQEMVQARGCLNYVTFGKVRRAWFCRELGPASTNDYFIKVGVGCNHGDGTE